MGIQRHTRFVLLLSVGVLSAFSGCNLFDPFNGPSGDQQLLSAARACFDRGDITCAKDLYARLDGTSESETAAAETAFAILDENGATMAAFMESMGGGGGGAILTTLAGKLANFGASSTRRSNIFGAYGKISSITTNTELRGLVRFVTGLALAAEMLAEDAGSDGVYQKSDLVSDPDGCRAKTTANCGVAAECTRGGSLFSTFSNNTAMLQTTDTLTGNLTWDNFDKVVRAIDYALNTELQSTGGFSSGAGGFASSVSGATGLNIENCYRFVLLSNEVGA